jgi:hypothetical protein
MSFFAGCRKVTVESIWLEELGTCRRDSAQIMWQRICRSTPVSETYTLHLTSLHITSLPLLLGVTDAAAAVVAL